MEIEGAVVLVTGGAKGLGLAIATHFHRAGARVVVGDRDEAALATLPEAIDRHLVDVTQPEQARALVEAVVERHGRLDVLVNNAGAIYSEPMVNVTDPAKLIHDYEQFRSCLSLNLDSVFVMTAAALEPMVRRRIRGVIVNISSISAAGNEGQTAYSAAKAGVNAMTVVWAKELGRLGIRCNAIAPGFIGTDSTRAALSEPLLKHVMGGTPLRRLGEATEVAQAVEAVVRNDFINGVVLDVDGGLRL